MVPLIAPMAVPVDEGSMLPLTHTVDADGQAIVGGVSHRAHCTVTVNDAVATLPQLSSAVYMMVVVPEENVMPLLMLTLNEATPQSSDTVGVLQVIGA